MTPDDATREQRFHEDTLAAVDRLIADPVAFADYQAEALTLAEVDVAVSEPW